jgi:type IV pilus assembly protein PilC
MASLAAQKHHFYTELAKLLGAGFGVREAAQAMRRSRVPKQQEDWLKRMEAGLAQGQTIAESLGGFESETRLERSILDAGERSGQMATSLQHLADYFGMMANVRRSATSAMIYPFFLLHLGILVSIFPIGLMRGTPMATMLGNLLASLLLAYGLFAVVFFGIKAALKSAADNSRTDAFLNSLPLVGKARRNLAMARFSMVYHASLLAGMAMSETVRTATAAAQSGLISSARQTLDDVLSKGDPMGPAFLTCRAFPDTFARSYMTAEVSGTLDHDLQRWANLFREDAERDMRILASTIPKIIYAIIVAYVGWQIMRFYLGYLADLDRIGDSL